MKTKFKKVECSGCSVGKRWCASRPCWPTPEESAAITAAGFGHRLMRDYWVETNGPDTIIMAPAIVGYEGQGAPFFPSGRCTFFTADEKCELHDLGLKPLEGAVACCKTADSSQPIREHIVELWKKVSHDD